jgi:hypothetical protein
VQHDSYITQIWTPRDLIIHLDQEMIFGDKRGVTYIDETKWLLSSEESKH